jgi:HPt (histidine-containing phosphotransfer) domain-containing protein
MNDYLTKPISPEALRMTIMAWAQLDEPAPPDQPEEPIPVRVVEAAKPALSLPAEVPHLKMADGLRAVGGNATLYRKLLGQFYADFRDAAPALSILLTTGDRAQVQLRAHSIKGVAATLGAEAVRNVAAKLEQAMKAGDAARGRTLIGELGGVLDDVMQSIKDLLANEEDAGEEAVPEEGSEMPVSGDVLALLTDLEEKLANQEYLDDAALAELRTVFSRGGGAHAWQDLEEAVGQYDYEQAQAAAGSLRELYRKKE